MIDTETTQLKITHVRRSLLDGPPTKLHVCIPLKRVTPPLPSKTNSHTAKLAKSLMTPKSGTHQGLHCHQTLCRPSKHPHSQTSWNAVNDDNHSFSKTVLITQDSTMKEELVVLVYNTHSCLQWTLVFSALEIIHLSPVSIKNSNWIFKTHEIQNYARKKKTQSLRHQLGTVCSKRICSFGWKQSL